MDSLKPDTPSAGLHAASILAAALLDFLSAAEKDRFATSLARVIKHEEGQSTDPDHADALAWANRLWNQLI